MEIAEFSSRNETTITDTLNLFNMRSSRLNQNYRNNFLVCVGNQYKRVSIDDISFFYAEGNIVYLVKKDNRKLIIDFSLEQIKVQLNPKNFFRVSRNLLVCSSCITKIHKYFNSRLKLEVYPQHSTDVLVTRSRVTDFLAWLNY